MKSNCGKALADIFLQIECQRDEYKRQRDLLLTEMRNFVRTVEKDIPVNVKTAAHWMKRCIAECEKGADND